MADALNWQVGDKYLTNENRVYEIDAIKGDRLFCISIEGDFTRILICDMNGNSIAINEKTGASEKLISLVDKSDTTYSINKENK